MTNCFMFPETFDRADACFPSRSKPRETSSTHAGRALEILMGVLDRHPEVRSDLMQALAEEGAVSELFGPPRE